MFHILISKNKIWEEIIQRRSVKKTDQKKF